FSQVSAESPTASALTLQTKASMPPSSPAVAMIHAVNADPSATSRARPNAFTPFAFRDATAPDTSSALRAPIETFPPSAANPSATARPIPLLPPVTTARFPFSPRFMFPLPPPFAREREPNAPALCASRDPSTRSKHGLPAEQQPEKPSVPTRRFADI